MSDEKFRKDMGRQKERWGKRKKGGNYQFGMYGSSNEFSHRPHKNHRSGNRGPRGIRRISQKSLPPLVVEQFVGHPPRRSRVTQVSELSSEIGPRNTDRNSRGLNSINFLQIKLMKKTDSTQFNLNRKLDRRRTDSRDFPQGSKQKGTKDSFIVRTKDLDLTRTFIHYLSCVPLSCFLS